jgi:tagatose 1,6-diphosphate aldolase
MPALTSRPTRGTPDTAAPGSTAADSPPARVRMPVHPLSIGRLRAFQRIFSTDGAALLLAADHGTTLAELLDSAAPELVGARALTDARCAVVEALAPLVDGVVLEPAYGAPEAVARGLLPHDTALLVSAECAPRFDPLHGVRISPLRAGWRAADARRLGADGAKLLVYHRADCELAVDMQRHIVETFVAECARHDLLSLVECRTYPLPDETPAAFQALRPAMLLDGARTLSALGADVVAIEWPGRRCDESAALALYEQIDTACDAPWLVTGTPDVNVTAFGRSVRLACRAGASGAIVGRLLWQEGLVLPNREWEHWLGTTGARGARLVRASVHEHAQPWWARYGGMPAALGEGRVVP